jgi:hypothetical protein
VSFLTSRTGSAPEGICKAIRRREDPRLVSGYDGVIVFGEDLMELSADPRTPGVFL